MRTISVLKYGLSALLPIATIAVLTATHVSRVAAAPTAGAGIVAQGCIPVEAPWNTSFGGDSGNVVMYLHAGDGNNITGDYDWKQGKIQGTSSGPNLTGTWSQSPSYQPPSDAGDFQITLAMDGCSFSGQWRYGSSGDWQPWTGTLQGH